MKIELRDETAEELRAMLRRRGEEDDVSAYVQRTVAKRLLFETVTELRRSAALADPEELRAAIEEALTTPGPAGQ